MPALPIGAHGLIGDLSTVALVGIDGEIDHLCWPRLDSPSVFASLLNHERGGSFVLRPEMADAQARQVYLPETNILSTMWRAPSGSAQVTDLMPVGDGKAAGPRLIRHVRATGGVVPVRLSCRPRYGYGEREAVAAAHAQGVRLSGADGDPVLLLSGTRPLAPGPGVATAAFELRPGEAAAAFLLEDGDAAAGPPLSLGETEDAIDRTRDHWKRWSARSTYHGRWRGAMPRSALVLKLLQSREHGSLAAAATFGLPERVGGDANWDYRATWIRDAAFTVYSFVRLGHVEEIVRFMRWIGERTRRVDWDGAGIRVMYRLDGGGEVPERELGWLAGHRGSRPVRVGNAAAGQFQLDLYGELLDSVYLNEKYGEAPGVDAWRRIRRAVEFVRDRWREPDAGIWEIRTALQRFLLSRVMCWVAVDRALRLATKRSLPADRAAWARLRDEIHDSVWDEFWSEEGGHLVESAGSGDVDGSMLLLPLVRFVPGTDPRWLATLDRIGEQLGDGALVYRSPAARRGEEGAFAACSFWHVECLARAGRLPEAEGALERLLGLGNHVGLFAEEFDAQGRALGNFPQALTHLALISAVHYVDRQLSTSFVVR